MSSPDNKDNLTKLSLEELEELHERQMKILKNKSIVDHLPDKGEQLKKKLERVKNELRLRRDVQVLEGTMKTLQIECQQSEILKEKHTQHICGIEKSPNKERYKPFSTLVKKYEKVNEKPTQLIPLAESMTLLAEQATKLPVEKVKRKIEGDEVEVVDAALDDENRVDLGEESDESEKT